MSIKYILKDVTSNLISPGKNRKFPGQRRPHIHRG